MSILIDQNTKLMTQGITGKAGLFHSLQCKEYGTQVVGGVTPKKGGSTIEGFPVWNTVQECKEQTDANTTMIFVPPPFAANVIIEAADAGIELIVAITEGIPVIDMIRVKNHLKDKNSILVGPNCPGIVTSGICKVGIAPSAVHSPGKVGIVSRSGTLTYEAVYQTTVLGLGQTTAIGIGGDSVHGLSHLDVVKMFNEDAETEGIVLIGEIGGTDEEVAAAYIKDHVNKPVAGFIAGVSAPKGKRMGHAGAIIYGSQGTAQSKIKVLEEAGVFVAQTASDIGIKMQEAFQQ